MVHYMNEVGANPGRSGHKLSVEASHIVEGARNNLARLFNLPDPLRIVFTTNVTESLNMVIYGFLKPGNHVITTSMEHNSVMRPLKHLEETSHISLSIARCDHKGLLDPAEVKRLIRKETALVVLNHASNVCGTIQDVKAVKGLIGDIPILVDAAQTGGCYPIDFQADGMDFLAFTGHKGLLGPQGTGGLYIRDGLKLNPIKRGGTGSVSEELRQPEFLPDALESGTQNNVGIAGLGAGVKFLLDKGIEEIKEHEKALTAAFLSGLRDLPGVTVYGPLKADLQTSTISITFETVLPIDTDDNLRGCGSINLAWMDEGIPQSEAGKILDSEYEILVRVGLHCAPMAHETLGTFPDGTVRFSMGYFNTLEQVKYVVEAISRIAENDMS